MTNDDDLGDWHASGARNYGEEGIPMILRVETVGASPPRAGEPATATAFRRLADALDLEPAALLEILAARELRRLAEGE